MAQLEFFLVAESCAIDSMTNRVSIFNVFEEIKAPQFPLHIPTLTAIAGWNADPGDEALDFQATLVAHFPDADPLRFNVNFRLPQARSRTVVRLEGFRIGAAGVRFEMLLNGEHKANHTIAATVIEAPVGAGQ